MALGGTVPLAQRHLTGSVRRSRRRLERSSGRRAAHALLVQRSSAHRVVGRSVPPRWPHRSAIESTSINSPWSPPTRAASAGKVSRSHVPPSSRLVSSRRPAVPASGKPVAQHRDRDRKHIAVTLVACCFRAGHPGLLAAGASSAAGGERLVTARYSHARPVVSRLAARCSQSQPSAASAS